MIDVDHPLIEFWRKSSFDLPPFIAPEDRNVLQDNALSIFHSLDEYASSPVFGLREDTSLHVGLLPVPYLGSLKNASIYILMLNPGLSPGDYFAEYRVGKFREVHLRNLCQENGDDDFPLFSLDPAFSWHSGYLYWQTKFDSIAQVLKEKENILYSEALKRLAQSIACLELMPYHSRSFGASSLLNKLPSVKIMLDYVHDILIPKALAGDVTIIATRSAKRWNLPEYENIVVYKGGETHAAHLTLDSRGGKAIAKHLGL